MNHKTLLPQIEIPGVESLRAYPGTWIIPAGKRFFPNTHLNWFTWLAITLHNAVMGMATSRFEKAPFFKLPGRHYTWLILVNRSTIGPTSTAQATGQQQPLKFPAAGLSY